MKQSRFTAVYLTTHLLDAPLFAMYSMLAFILTKDLAVTALQITVYASVKPLTALFSAYWNDALRSQSIEKNLSLLIGLACLPALLFPFIESAWFFIFGFVAYFIADRAAISGWMELLKTKTPPEGRGWVVSKCSLFMYLAGAVVPVVAAPWMDRGVLNWRWLFFGLACVSLLRLVIILPLAWGVVAPPKEKGRRISVLGPWKRALLVLRRRPDFSYFQLIFLFGGTGIILMHPVLPKFVSGVLQLSYTDLALAFAFSKAMGYICSARLWAWAVKQTDIYLFCSVVSLFAALCLFLIPLSVHHVSILYIAFFLYGVMQGGSHLGWQLSGPAFSGKEVSTSYTGVSVMAIGLRGCFAPSIGALLGLQFGFVPTLLIGGTTCLIGTIAGFVGHRIWGPSIVAAEGR